VAPTGSYTFVRMASFKIMAETKYGIDDAMKAMGGTSFLEYANTPNNKPSIQTVLAYTVTGVVTGFGTAVLASKMFDSSWFAAC